MSKTLTPKQIAERYGVGLNKVCGWIQSGLLVAIDVSSSASSKPRWRVPEEALADFERRRSSSKPPAPSSRRPRKPADLVEYV